jgi:diguanylate cyclase (GGDEF)-like protein/PAS domain S-box-containing protein
LYVADNTKNFIPAKDATDQRISRSVSLTSPPPKDSDEISVIIKALREQDLRLGKLTSGEADTTADREGRAVLLQRVQNQLRGTEAANQSAIINAIPAQIAVLDMAGLVISVNEMWGRSTAGSPLNGPACGVGSNYLQMCDQTRGPDSLVAHRAAAGIRSVLSGAHKSFSMEYPCELPTERRWFLLATTPLDTDRPRGAVIMHVDITDQKRGEDSQHRFAAAMDATTDAIFLVDRTSMRYIHVNEAACRLQAQTRDSLLASSPAQVSGIEELELAESYDRLIESGVDAKPVEIKRHASDGSTVWLELRRYAQCSSDGWTIVSTLRDVTDRKEAETRIIHLNRMHAMLSGINTLIVRVRDRDELFREACRIATDEGGFRMIWIGLIDPATQKMIPMASVGVREEFMTDVRDRFTLQEGSPLGNTLTARAVRGAKPFVANNLETDTDVLYHAEHFAAGIRSMAVFPLIIGDLVVGVVALYAFETEFFHADEMKLLTEITGDVAFAIDHIEKQERLDYLAYYDVLTGLANRALFLERTAQYMRGATAGDRRKLALFLIDLERFKNINDSLGRPAGDLLLKQVAAWLTQAVGDASLLARVDADHFGILLPDLKSVGEVMRLLKKTMLAFLSHPFQLNDAVFRIAAKAGVAVCPDDGTDADTLFKNAESALKKAKLSGEKYLCYSQNMTVSVAGRLTLENQLRQGLERKEFALYYEPKVNLASGEITGAEALLRWNDPLTGLVSPNRIIPILEETGLMHDVGRWALNEAVETYRRWRTMGLKAVCIAVNVSPMQLRNRDFAAEIRQAIADDPLAAAGLELEITESLIMEDVRLSIASLRVIRALGVRIAIDDFGTGFSSLSYLARLPLHTLKIDRSFVIDMAARPEGLALVSTIINLAHSMKLNVIAEGVETEEQARLLRLLDCDEMQGYHFGRPVPRDVFEAKYLGAAAPTP